MGRDASIYFEMTSRVIFDVSDLLPGCCAKRHDGLEHPEGATHEVEVYERLWCPGYPVGNWPTLSSILMALHASKMVGRVWYGSFDGSTGINEFSPEAVLAYTEVFMKRGRQ